MGNPSSRNRLAGDWLERLLRDAGQGGVFWLGYGTKSRSFGRTCLWMPGTAAPESLGRNLKRLRPGRAGGSYMRLFRNVNG